ncbi:hypothetical protein IW261DRAFT_1565839 [Armillaria novae-zelandiae]|uniref:Uncharacterized protein n=1 Tax=Armillaria novae-zelandiae TaxID=153914 RepID=A0AA39P589_9AGAR|nr:hypothetical protein IW261DRAFT_1565839 [Armillaria novae-zelandiae]
MPFTDAQGFTVLQDYFDVLGIRDITELKEGMGLSDDDPALFLGAVDIELSPSVSEGWVYGRKISLDIRLREGPLGHKKGQCLYLSSLSYSVSTLPCSTTIHQLLDGLRAQVILAHENFGPHAPIQQNLNNINSGLDSLHAAFISTLNGSPACANQLHLVWPVTLYIKHAGHLTKGEIPQGWIKPAGCKIFMKAWNKEDTVPSGFPIMWGSTVDLLMDIHVTIDEVFPPLPLKWKALSQGSQEGMPPTPGGRVMTDDEFAMAMHAVWVEVEASHRCKDCIAQNKRERF